jgi:predicted nucleotidyltransferase
LVRGGLVAAAASTAPLPTAQRESAAWYALVVNLSPSETAALVRFRAFLDRSLGERFRACVLFGSRARGEGHEDSDLDVLVLIEQPTREERTRIIDEAYDIEIEMRVAISPLVRDVDSWPGMSPLAAEVARDGVSL